MKKVKKFIISVFAVFTLFTGTGFSLSPRDFFMNYGGGIEKGDILPSVSIGMPWAMLGTNRIGWVAPSILGEVEVACPIASIPFSFGGYLSADFRGTYDGYYGYYNEWGAFKPYDPINNPYGYYFYDNTVYGHCILRTGGIATYHVAIPPVEGLDLSVSMKMGLNLDFSNWYKNKVRAGFDFGIDFGASYYFNDNVGIKAEIGYPYGSVGAVFKL